jgi:hypothetical protein
MPGERRYVRIGWTDPGLGAQTGSREGLVDQLLDVWVTERRRVRVVTTDGGFLDAQLLAYDREALYVAGTDGFPRLIFRPHVREVVLLEPDGVE